MKKFVSFLIVSLCVFQPLFAQSIAELEKQKKQALENLAQTNKLLNETQKSKQGSVNKINLIKRNINERKTVIQSINGQIAVLEKNIDVLRSEKYQLEERLSYLKADYAKLIRETHMRRNHFSPLLFILSSDNAGQAYRRFRYLQEFSSYRKKQALEIQVVTEQLVAKEKDLTNDVDQKERALTEKEREAKKLESDRQQESKMLTQLQRKEKQLKDQQKKQQRQANELNSKIQKLIAAEIRKEEERRKREASESAKQTGKPVPTTFEMSKDEQLVAGNFEKNRGKLPLPVEKGFISGHFGVQPHPVLKHVTTNNKGIYIQAPAGSSARAVFEGVVTQCFMVPGSNSAVIVKHGNYRTVYSNLTELYVKEGDKVSTKQQIGKIFVDTENDNKTELYLMLYRDTSIQNPELWLAR
ncbi:MAG TPA: peptidoglycan DD-metalloendopeptidase family protein [Paludibacteraceae bacterium]|nr:peptidoglycan DD-metalloendopeptidase family protein [Paludibacteraceae bacterium]HQB68654.1 peptidoglycan DD-metalloendopeptidase family protein [Paludibacteraceae bacterium]HRS67512.1 peptidoglycan DD-metalloendopeptidase family protein [Paludibacteraceae bacterium]